MEEKTKTEKSAEILAMRFIEKKITFQELINLIMDARNQRDKYKDSFKLERKFHNCLKQRVELYKKQAKELWLSLN